MAKASDNVFPYLHVSPGAAPASPASGSQRLYLDSADGNKLKRKDSSGTVVTVEGGSSLTYTTYTPTLTAATTNPTLGTGATATGRYYTDGKHVEGDVNIIFGSSLSAGSGSYRISLPVNNANDGTFFPLLGSVELVNGAGTAFAVGVASRQSLGKVQVVLSGGSVLGSSGPGFAWDAGSAILLHFSYESV